MAYGQSSGTTSYNPFAQDLVIDAYERQGIYELETRHWVSARRTCNLLLISDWSNRGINLWKIDTVPTVIDLVQGTRSYLLPTNTVGMFDTMVHTPANLSQGNASDSIIPLLVGTPVPQASQITTTQGSNIVKITWPANGLSALTSISILSPIVIGGLTLGGVYTILSVLDVNNFVINVTFNATASQTITVNGTGGIDILMTPISRNDYAAIAYKDSQGQPTTYWFQREIVPQVSIWPVADSSGPYQLQTYLMRQIEDVNPTGGQTLNLVQRFYYAFVSDLARDLSIKWAPDKYQMLKAEADAAWDRAQATDIEDVSLFVLPNLSGYG